MNLPEDQIIVKMFVPPKVMLHPVIAGWQHKQPQAMQHPVELDAA